DLMLLLAHLLVQDADWRRTRIVLKSVVDGEDEVRPLAAGFEAMLREIRIAARVDVVVRPPGETVREVIRRESLAAELVFLGLRIPDAGQEDEVAAQLVEMLRGLRSAILVRNGGPF